MPSGPRIRGNNAFGVITDNPLTIGATTMNSAGLAFLPTVSSAHAVITLDPIRQHGAPEIVIVTAHTAASTAATITRGAYGTVARAHPQGTSWAHAPINEDVISNVLNDGIITDPYRGQAIFNRTDNALKMYGNNDNWVQVMDLGQWDVYTPSNTGVTLGNGTQNARWTRMGRTVHFRYQLQFGTTTAFTSTIGIGLPVTATTVEPARSIQVVGAAIDVSVEANVRVLTATTIDAGARIQPNADGTFGTNGTVPFTWATGDFLQLAGTYEAAS